MAVDTWKRLNELEKAIREEFANTGCPTGGCPPGPRVHMIYAHYGALPEPDKVLDKWRYATIDSYKNAAPKPREARVAADYLAAHFLWLFSKDANFAELPNLEEDVKATVDDGGTLVHFKNTNLDKAKVPTKAKGKAKIPDFNLVYRAGQTSPSGEATTGEDATGIPKRRRLCLSIPGSAGEHKDIDASGDTVEEKINYPVPPQHNELRLFSVSPGFKFEVGGKAVATTDPWTELTRDITGSGKLEEKSSSTYVGKVVSSKWGKGVAKYASEGTDTSELAGTYGSQLGDSRVKVFKAVKNVEGGCESIATYDGPKISWGINQWTLPSAADGELWQILAFIYDFFPKAFARRFSYYGIGLWFESRSATWSKWTTYKNVIVYRVPCCGPKTRAGIDAVFAAGKDAVDNKNGESGDKPPGAMKKIADALKVTRDQTTSYGWCHMLTTAGADADIQKAQAQWMSYRITSTSPVGKTISTVINEFLKSLGSNMSDTDRFNNAVSALKGEYDKAGVTALLAESFSDDGADKEWIDWPTRCTNAGKSTKSVSARSSAKARTQPAGKGKGKGKK